MKAVWAGAAAIILIMVGMWATAQMDIGDRIHEFDLAARELGMARRGGELMDEDEVMDALEELAEEHGVEIVEMEVGMEPLTDDNIGQADEATQQITAELAGRGGGSTPDDRGIHRADDERVDMGSGAMSVEGTVVEVTADIHVKKWMWSADEKIEFSKTLGRQMTMDR